MLLQNYTRTTARGRREVVKRREKDDEKGGGLPPGKWRLTSPYDTDARWSAKRDTFWNGFKVHISETCATEADDTARPAPAATATATATAKSGANAPHGAKPGRVPNRPNLITNIATNASTLPDSKALDSPSSGAGCCPASTIWTPATPPPS
ncbi:hypothetical protein FCI23_50670 [Actinacidiphila oryziradicis]|uniref:Uncharacterized protein n=1 Tax=Actinacidiphila oryziradicis TaxID=2571141 RepID=A0A4U0RMS8_9ACTN|nr:hypothetical protein FCI23_50670 [Actinacidiphila oryziradicis]